MMNFLVPPRLFDAGEPEMIDREDNDPALLEQDLRNLRVINRYFGGLSAVKRPLLCLIRQVPREKTLEILDLATGSADHPIEIAKLARSLSRSVRIVAVDKNAQILEIARRQAEGFPEITTMQEDLLQLDFADKSFDIVLCSLALHHFSNQDAIAVLSEMKRLSRVGFIVNDLNRSWIGACTAWFYTHATTRNPLTLNDSYISVLRAFTPAELSHLAEKAGISDIEVSTKLFFRLLLVGSFRSE
ncbi:MAG: methyltransferase domain-containing protein [Ignavibacteriales bacterium]|nr:methyltransferase domain-containing protein [Ignavibacteriales bacterium]